MTRTVSGPPGAAMRCFWLCMSLAIFVLFPPAAQPAARAAAPDLSAAAETWTAFDRPGKFITALCVTDDVLWIGTEDRGLWWLDLAADPARADAWRQFIGDDSPRTEHVYAIAEDTFGRIWVGTLNQGVSVWNGKEWANFGVLDGCGGERVFAIAADKDPKRGHVWIGTDHGLTCWSPDLAVSADGTKGKWFTYTQVHGLPSQQIYAVAVAPSGRAWAGTECDGLAWSNPPYRKWNPVRAAGERSGDEGELPGLDGGTGAGLPSNLSNALLALRDNTIVYGTNYGLGLCRAGGMAWATWQGISKQPFENYIRGMAADSAGRLWLATRHKGLVRFDPKTGEVKRYTHPTPPKAEKGKPAAKSPPPSLPDNYVFDVAVAPAGDVWAGTYGGGLARLRGATCGSPANTPGKGYAGSALGTAMLNRAGQNTPAVATPVAPAAGSNRNLQLPAPAAPPTLEELNAMLAELVKVPFILPDKQPCVARLDDDWSTRGNWLGRRGTFWTCLCGYISPYDYIYGSTADPIQYTSMIGPNCEARDSIRYWVHWLYTQDPRVLEMTTAYLDSRVQKGLTHWDVNRRQAEWDDHGEAYPMGLDGPDLFVTLNVPAGEYVLSLYFVNKDGHTARNRWRDYTISIREGRFTDAGYSDTPTKGDLGKFHRLPEAARARVKDFWYGVYKQFYVRGPRWYSIRISRNHSYNTTLSGLMLDRLECGIGGQVHGVEKGSPSAAQMEAARNLLRERGSEPAGRPQPPYSSEDEAMIRLSREVDLAFLRNSLWWCRSSRPTYAALAAWHKSTGADAFQDDRKCPWIARFASYSYRLALYEKWEEGLDLLGIPTPRAVQQCRRWDAEKFRIYVLPICHSGESAPPQGAAVPN